VHNGDSLRDLAEHITRLAIRVGFLQRRIEVAWAAEASPAERLRALLFRDQALRAEAHRVREIATEAVDALREASEPGRGFRRP
jgi:hypothetical protein